MRTIVALAIAALAIAGGAGAATGPPQSQSQPEVRSLDGSGNNVRHPDWGQTFTQYLRVTDPNYADGVSQPVSGPSARYISNRIFNDEGQNLFSENGVTQWGWTWGQFLDHTFGLRDETPAENLPIPFDKHDPLEEFQNDVGSIDFARTPAAPGTGTSKHNPRQQINTVSSYIDAFSVYGGTNARLEWLRTGPVDGNMANNGATLMLTPDGYLPRADARGNAATAPPMDLMGALTGTPSRAVEAGDVRANENIALTAVHTLFAREHNRIVGLLPVVALERAEVPDRPPRRRRGGAVHHVQRVPPRHGRAAGAVPGLRPAREREPLDRVRDRRLPDAQHGARRVRHRRSRRDVLGIAARDVPSTRGSTSRRRRTAASSSPSR